jgi:hypothetical protein
MFPTTGPLNRYSFVLFVEKEGFDALLAAADIARRYDIAIMSTKGMSVTAARRLVDDLAALGITVLVLRDFDKSGFSIVHTLTTNSRRYKFRNKPKVIDVGLRLEDAQAMGLASEPVTYPAGVDPRVKLRECGATEEECNFLVHGRRGEVWYGERIELNSMMSRQFIDFLERVFEKFGVRKLVPHKGVVEEAYRRARAVQRARKAAEDALQEAKKDKTPVPPKLRDTVAETIEGTAMAWDQAVWDMAENEKAANETKPAKTAKSRGMNRSNRTKS